MQLSQGSSQDSVGHYRILENVAGDIELFQTDGIGESNWWGEDPPGVDIYAGGSFEVNPVLLTDPRP